MVVILFLSTDIGSASSSYHLLKPLFDWWYKGRPQPNVYEVNLLLRKTLHVIEFAVLATLVARARLQLPRPPRFGTLGVVTLSLSIVLLFAMGSELVQYFMKHRGASWSDVALNTVAGILGLIILYICRWIRSLFPKRGKRI